MEPEQPNETFFSSLGRVEQLATRSGTTLNNVFYCNVRYRTIQNCLSLFQKESGEKIFLFKTEREGTVPAPGCPILVLANLKFTLCTYVPIKLFNGERKYQYCNRIDAEGFRKVCIQF
jgi:hypothetical protein